MRLREFSNDTESTNKDDFVDMFKKFLPIAIEVLEIQGLPKFVFEPTLETGDQPSFGMYSPDERTLYVALANRHPVDILRTIAHELVHFRQDQRDELNSRSGETGSPQENQAHELAGVTLRVFNRQYPEFLKSSPLSEASSQ